MWIGIDIGTTAVKTAAYTKDGKIAAASSAPSTVRRIENGGIEQDMSAVWETVCGVLKDLVSKIDVSEIECIGVAGQGDGLWAVDEKGEPCGPAMLWNDTRAADDVVQLNESGSSAFVAHGCHTSLWPGTSGPLWRWLRSNDPETAQRVSTIFTCPDWITLKLTGERATDFSNASIPFLDFRERRYSRKSLEALECPELDGTLLSPRRAAEILGVISQGASRETGLPAGIPVSVSTLDLSAMIVGMGLDQPGQAMMIIGTTAVVNILTDRVKPSDLPVGASVLHPTSDAIIRVLAPTTGAGAFDWFAGLHPASLGGESVDEVAGKINELVEQVPPGAGGVTFLPYLNGERAPFVQPGIRASFNGMSADTTRADMGRAVIEGTGYSLRHCIEDEGGLPDGPIQLTGGGSKNEVWCQIIADIVGQPIQTSSASDQGLWGIACIGASAIGLGEAVHLSKRHEELRTYRPDNTRHQQYDTLFQRYRIYSDSSRKTCSELRKLESTQ